MLKDLIKLADFLDQRQQKEFANQIDEWIQKLATSPYRYTSHPEKAPYRFETQQSGDITGEWNRADLTHDLEEDIEYDLKTEEVPKPTSDLKMAIQQFLDRSNQYLKSIAWQSVNRDSELHQGQPYWSVTAVPGEPTQVPDKFHWAFWEVTPDDSEFDQGISISGQQTRIYGEQ